MKLQSNFKQIFKFKYYYYQQIQNNQIMKSTILWHQEQQTKLIQLYRIYGKQFTRILKELLAAFGDQGKFNLNRIHSKISSIMRQGIVLLMSKSKEDRHFTKAIEQQSITKIVQKIMGLSNQTNFETKVKLVQFKMYPNSYKQGDMYQMKNLILQMLNKLPSKKVNPESQNLYENINREESSCQKPSYDKDYYSHDKQFFSTSTTDKQLRQEVNSVKYQILSKMRELLQNEDDNADNNQNQDENMDQNQGTQE